MRKKIFSIFLILILFWFLISSNICYSKINELNQSLKSTTDSTQTNTSTINKTDNLQPTNSSLVSETKFAKFVVTEKTETGTVIDDDPNGLNVREKPWGKILGTLKKGTKIDIVAREGEWYKILYKNGYAYVYASLVSTSKSGNLTQSNNKKSPVVSSTVPYFCQLNNKYAPYYTCQNTSIAMLLAKYGWKGKPDDITVRFGRNLGKNPIGAAQIFNTLAAESGLRVRVRAHTAMSVSKFISLLQQGKPLITYGWFTTYGHVVVTTGYDGQNFKVNDPAGKWVQSFKGGYNYSASGNGVLYNKNAYLDAIYDGGIWVCEPYEI